MTKRRHPDTAAVRSGLGSDTNHGAVVAPLYLSSNFTFAGFDRRRTYDYTRSGNPTRDALAEALAELEGGRAATITSSGMAAITLVCQLLQKDDLLIAPHDCYGGTHRLLRALDAKGACRVEFVDLTSDSALDAIFQKQPKMLLVETPSNPLLRITDIAAIAQRCRAAGALLVVDNTFLSPVWQQPIRLGADLVVHSTTKYLNGHSDVVGGAVVARTEELGETIDWWANCTGISGAPFDAFLTLRGLRTLCARSRLHCENTERIVDFLRDQELVQELYYPGLESHPGHKLASRQQSGFGAMLSFELAGDQQTVRRFLSGLQHFFLAESLGGVESLIAHPATMTHASMEAEAREAAGISDQLLRLSVGIENCDDLLADLDAAFVRAARPARQLRRPLRLGSQDLSGLSSL